MRIGLTYDLRQDYLAEGYSLEETAEFDRPDTVEAIEAALVELGYQPDRIGNAKQLIARLAAGDRWDLVFNIAEGLYGLAREAQVPAILDVFNIPYTFSDPLVLSLALHKGITKSVVRQGGVATPDFALVEREADIDAIDLPFPLFAKPVAEGTSKGISGASKIADRQALRAVCVDLLRKFRQPVLVETFLSGREFTVGVTGTGDAAVAVGTMEILLLPEAEAEIYSYENKAKYEEPRALPAGPPGGRSADRRGRAADACRLAGVELPRRRAGRCPLRRRRRAQFHRSQPAARPAPAAFRPADGLRLRRRLLRRSDRPDRPLGPAQDRKARAGQARLPERDARASAMRVAVLHNFVPADAPPEDQDTLVQVEAICRGIGRLGHEPRRRPLHARFGGDARRAAAAAARRDLQPGRIAGRGRFAGLSARGGAWTCWAFPIAAAAPNRSS